MMTIWEWNKEPITFENVKTYEFKKGFLCMALVNGKLICYNLKWLKKFEVD